jgi:hypothetical protein
MIRTISQAQAVAELTPNGESRTVTSWLNVRDNQFLGISANRKSAQVKREPFTPGSNYLARIFCRSTEHARWAERYCEDVIIISS